MNSSATLLIHCPDRPGLVAVISEFLFSNNGNILHFDQHVDSETQTFFMRVVWELGQFSIPKEKIGDYFQTLIASKFTMHFELFFSENKPKMGVFVSKLSHCLFDLLSRQEAGELDVEIPFILSNHQELEPVAKRFGLPFFHVPNSKETKVESENEMIRICEEHSVDFIVLARYMQILSGDFIAAYPHRIINIHHSFLPAFPGAKPYHSAFARGVKIIGATSHYVTEELDAGPIIEQDVARVSHRDSIEDLVRKGRDLEKLVLSRAVYKHVNRMVLVYGNKTVVF